jgi:hypothetical protein
MATKLTISKGNNFVQAMVFLPSETSLTDDQQREVERLTWDLAEAIREYLIGNQARSTFQDRVRTPQATFQDRVKAAVGPPPEDPRCPKCKGPMQMRTRRDDQSKFWGCKAYPVCKGTRNSAQAQADMNAAPLNNENHDELAARTDEGQDTTK